MTVVATLIFVVTLVLVIWQPKGLGIGWSALGGAVLAVITTVVSLSDIPTVWDIVWNATFAFVVIVLISLILDESGLFEWAALHVARWGRGNGRVLFVLIVILGAVIAALFANDGAALILTPIVTVIVTVTVTASLGVLMLYLRKAIPRRYDPLGLAEPRTAIHDPLTFKAGFVVLGVLLVGYLAAKPLHIPLSAVAGLGAVVLALVASRKPAFLFARANNLAFAPVAADSNRQHGLGDLNNAAQAGIDAADTLTAGADAAGGLRRISVKTVFKETPWQIVLFLIGMYLFVYGLRNQGLTDQLAGVFSSIGDNGVLITALGVGVIVAALASIMNNMPTVLIAALTISAAGATGLTQEVMIYANVIGSDPGPRTPDPGPKITPIGSLATLLWLHVLDRKGIHIGWASTSAPESSSRFRCSSSPSQPSPAG